MRGGQLIREARLRAGLTQTELAERTGRERSVIARWEQGAVSPSVDNLLAIVEACGYDLPLVLIPRDTSQHETLDEDCACSHPSGASNASSPRSKRRTAGRG